MWRALLEKKPVAFALDLKDTYDRVGVEIGRAHV